MRIAYWMALVLGLVLIGYVLVFEFLVLVYGRLSSAMPVDCQPIGLIGVGCGPAQQPGYLYEVTLGIRALVGGFLVWAFFRYRRGVRTGE